MARCSQIPAQLQHCYCPFVTGRRVIGLAPQSALRGALQCSPQIARPSVLDRSALAQLLEPPCTDPYARWCGRGGAARLPPIPIIGPNAKCAMSALWSPSGEKRTSHTICGRCYCARNLYATISATMLAKISRAGRDFRIIGLVEWRAADGPG